MEPYCPVCKKRVAPVVARLKKGEQICSLDSEGLHINEDALSDGDFLAMKTDAGDTMMRINICSECGAAFDPDRSESLAPKCSKCGGEEWRDELRMTGGRAPRLCRRCDDREAATRRLADAAVPSHPVSPTLPESTATPPPVDPRDERIGKLEEALKAIASDEACPFQEARCPDDTACGVCIARKFLEKHS